MINSYGEKEQKKRIQRLDETIKEENNHAFTLKNERNGRKMRQRSRRYRSESISRFRGIVQ